MDNKGYCLRRAQRLIKEGRCTQCKASKENSERLCPDCLEKERERQRLNRMRPKFKLSAKEVERISSFVPVRRAAPCEPPSQEELEKIRNMPANAFGRPAQLEPTIKKQPGSGQSSALDLMQCSAKADDTLQPVPDPYLERFFKSIHQTILANRSNKGPRFESHSLE